MTGSIGREVVSKGAALGGNTRGHGEGINMVFERNIGAQLSTDYFQQSGM